MLKHNISKLNTNWKDILLKYPHLDELECMYQYECDKDTSLEIFPKQENIFKCFNYFDYENTKVIIIGQDPYHGAGQATGLAFAVNENTKQPPSLKNIFKELQNSDTNNTLESWAKQGVLLLNSYLTVRECKPNSHAYIWKAFTQWVLKELNSKSNTFVTIIWGAHAHTTTIKSEIIKDCDFISSHPSPLSAMKKYKNFPPFLGSHVFTNVNKYLSSQDIIPIQW